jgi:hypothetical protein
LYVTLGCTDELGTWSIAKSLTFVKGSADFDFGGFSPGDYWLNYYPEDGQFYGCFFNLPEGGCESLKVAHAPN